MAVFVSVSAPLSVEELRRLSVAYHRLRLGLPVCRELCELILRVSPLDSFTAAREKYRALSSSFCKKSGSYEEVLYELHRRAWDVLREDRW